MVYTSYEMIRDCRAGLPEGWSYLITTYVPVIRKLLAHYSQDTPAQLEQTLAALRRPEAGWFAAMEPSPERWFVAELRQKILLEIPAPAPEIALDLDTVASALEPLTLVEKQAAWLETMRYSAAQSGPMLRMTPQTVEKIRGRAAELIRGKVDAWNRTLLSDNGAPLGRTAAAAATSECLGPKVFLDILDGRMTWRGREELERHVTLCWHCIDHFCRMVEVVELLRGIQPLSEAEAEPLRKLLGVRLDKPPMWKRWLGAS